MFGFRKKSVDRVRSQQAKRILDLEAELEAAQRTISIRDAELESLGAVLARDRQRVLSETAAYASVRARTELEGTHGQLSR